MRTEHVSPMQNVDTSLEDKAAETQQHSTRTSHKKIAKRLAHKDSRKREAFDNERLRKRRVKR